MGVAGEGSGQFYPAEGAGGEVGGGGVAQWAVEGEESQGAVRRGRGLVVPCSAPTWTFSATVRVGKTASCWKVRAIPRRVRAWAGRRVMSRSP